MKLCNKVDVCVDDLLSYKYFLTKKSWIWSWGKSLGRDTGVLGLGFNNKFLVLKKGLLDITAPTSTHTAPPYTDPEQYHQPWLIDIGRGDPSDKWMVTDCVESCLNLPSTVAQCCLRILDSCFSALQWSSGNGRALVIAGGDCELS